MASANAVARAERSALADLFLEVGPDAPTLCEGWATRDLAAHLVLRERRPEALGLAVPLLRGRMERVQGSMATRPWPELVAEVRQGPPFWNPMGFAPIDGQANTIEFFVHHEDVLRARDGWSPRELDEATVAALWSPMPALGRAILRSSPVGVAVTPSDGPDAGTTSVIRGGEPSVTLVGPVGEIALAVFGRVTRGLEIVGAEADVEAFLAFPR